MRRYGKHYDLSQMEHGRSSALGALCAAGVETMVDANGDIRPLP